MGTEMWSSVLEDLETMSRSPHPVEEAEPSENVCPLQKPILQAALDMAAGKHRPGRSCPREGPALISLPRHRDVTQHTKQSERPSFAYRLTGNARLTRM